MKQTKAPKNDAKKVFREKGTCSRTFAYLLNREFGYPMEEEEQATDPLAGGIMRKGHQCGMLWGSALAIGAESYRRTKNVDKAIGLAITATKQMLESFENRNKTLICREITGCNMDNFFGMAKYMLKVTLQGMDNSTCFKLAEDWTPEALQSTNEGLSQDLNELPDQAKSCASEVVKKMGGSEEEMAMVAGFAGGLGLSGYACGALSAAIWMNSLSWVKENTGKSAFNNKKAKQTLKAFNNETNSEMLCHKICGQHFNSISEHSDFIKNGGCKNLINALSVSL